MPCWATMQPTRNEISAMIGHAAQPDRLQLEHQRGEPEAARLDDDASQRPRSGRRGSDAARDVRPALTTIRPTSAKMPTTARAASAPGRGQVVEGHLVQQDLLGLAEPGETGCRAGRCAVCGAARSRTHAPSVSSRATPEMSSVTRAAPCRSRSAAGRPAPRQPPHAQPSTRPKASAGHRSAALDGKCGCGVHALSLPRGRSTLRTLARIAG